MPAELGLRERKKHKTRLLITETARRLFTERGFEAVSVAEIARAAEVSEATVYNYFPTKEDLVYHGMEAFETQLLAAISQRPAGEPVIDAFARFITQARGLLDGDETSQQALLSISRMIAASPALLARERQILASYTDSLATLLRQETGAGDADLRPTVAASTLIGLHAALIDYVRRRLLDSPPDIGRLARDLQRESHTAFELLRAGLGDYALKPPSPNPIDQPNHEQATTSSSG